MLAQDMEQQKPTGVESCGNGILEMGFLFLSPTLMFLTEAPASWQFCFPALHAQPGGKHMHLPQGFQTCLVFTLLNSSFAICVNLTPKEIKLALICQIFLWQF